MAGNIYARMGFVGFVKLIPTSNGTNPITVRVTNADVKLTQEITYPDLVDGKIDQTVYQLGPQVVGGNIAFPLVHDLSANAGKTGTACGTGQASGSLASTLWQYAAERNEVGRMANPFDLIVRYADNLAYQYTGCYVNQMNFTITQSEPVNVSAEIIGGAASNEPLRKEYTSSDDNTTNFLSPARIVTWNDALVSVWGENGLIFDQATNAQLREFTCSINNNIERFYGLNGVLAPIDIAAKKRELSGTLKILGANYTLSQQTASNDQRYSSNSSIAFGYTLGGSGSTYFATALVGVVFEIEEVSLSTGLFETSTRWRATGDCANNHLATYLGGAPQSLTRPNGPSSDYGGSVAPNYPTFGSFSA